MRELLKKLQCRWYGHDLVEIRRPEPRSRFSKLACARCGAAFCYDRVDGGMSPWDEKWEEHFRAIAALWGEWPSEPRKRPELRRVK